MNIEDIYNKISSQYDNPIIGDRVAYKAVKKSIVAQAADYQYEVGDFVSWSFSGGTAKGEIKARENTPGNSLSVDGGSREATEDEPVYKMKHYEDGEFKNDVVKSESELRSVQKPDDV